jgi:hypothetical protein
MVELSRTNIPFTQSPLAKTGDKDSFGREVSLYEEGLIVISFAGGDETFYPSKDKELLQDVFEEHEYQYDKFVANRPEVYGEEVSLAAHERWTRKWTEQRIAAEWYDDVIDGRLYVFVNVGEEDWPFEGNVVVYAKDMVLEFDTEDEAYRWLKTRL